MKKENRSLQTQLKEKENEIAIIQEKYEDELNQAKTEKDTIIAQNKRIEDGLQYEIEFFKKEIARITKKEELNKQFGTGTDQDNFFSARVPEK